MPRDTVTIRKKWGYLQPPPTGDILTSLVRYYPLDDSHVSAGASGVLDLAASPRTGTLTGGVTSTSTSGIPSAQYATARAFDGVAGSRITLDSNQPMLDYNAGSFSVGLWVYITNNAVGSSGGSNQTYIMDQLDSGAGTDYLRIWNDSANPGLIIFGVSGGGGGTQVLTATGTVPNNTWTHRVYTNNGGGFAGTPTVYKNGAAISTSAGSSGISAFADTTHCNFGTGSPTDGMLTGRLYKIVAYNRVLIAADVAALYASG
jgi:hypothetical protein